MRIYGALSSHSMMPNAIGQEETYHIGRMMVRNFALLLLTFYFSQAALAANTVAETPEMGFIELVMNESNQIKAFLHTRVSLLHIHSVLAEYSEKSHRVVCCEYSGTDHGYLQSTGKNVVPYLSIRNRDPIRHMV